MKTKLVIPEAVSEAQAKASDPRQSVWVSANAGSGKTFVLTQRVVRLLLNGTDPSRILCLTFTKAAAAEMSNRVFDLLGEWAVLEDKELRTEIQNVEGRAPDRETLKRARQLFARALETPGGLKIQTIHAFCEALLHQFPIEANIAGHFEVLDDPGQKALMMNARRKVLQRAYSGRDIKMGEALEVILANASDSAVEKSLDEIVTRRDPLKAFLSYADGDAHGIRGLLRTDHGIENNATPSSIASEFTPPQIPQAEFQAVMDALTNSTTQTDAKLLSAFVDTAEMDDPEQILALWKPLFLTDKSQLRKRICTNTVEEFPAAKEAIDHSAQDLVSVLDKLARYRMIDASDALFSLANSMIDQYTKSKRELGLLDFDDLVIKASNLLSRSEARAWVQFKLDKGIDHILVDEAQDTSPRQWDVISVLAQEFFAGQGAREVDRTVFAVGDEKQSIYSFQGAKPEQFADQRDTLSDKATKAKKPFEKVELEYSFRSTADVLGAVDLVFSAPQNHQGLSRDGTMPPPHFTVRTNDPGRVDIWPMIQKEKEDESEHWADPVDQLSSSSPQVQLAGRIANQISRWINDGLQVTVKNETRAVQARDIFVLVRSRDKFVTALTRALKDQDIPIAGADRLVLTSHIATQDLIALGRAVLLPEDDLALAGALKSPIFGINEEILFEIANPRDEKTQSLFDALKTHAQSNPATEKVMQRFEVLRNRADQIPVHEFYATLLSADGVRKRFLERMGIEVIDVLDAFLVEALNQEKRGLPGLEAFIARLEVTEPEIKRELDLQKDEVRIMTTHAAKGLEAPIVFLIDKNSKPFHDQHAPKLIEYPATETPTDEKPNSMVWRPSADKENRWLEHQMDGVKAEAEKEYQRLLYVGMTRAADRLIIAGYCGVNGPLKNCWHAVVKNALQDGAKEIPADGWSGPILAWRKDGADPSQSDRCDASVTEVSEPATLPDWVHKRLPPEPILPRPLTPSGAQALIDNAEPEGQGEAPDVNTDEKTHPAFALQRGIAVHRLLQVLPDLEQSKRQEEAENYLASIGLDWPEGERARLLDQVNQLIDDPRYAHLFVPETSRAEANVMGALEFGSVTRLVSGQIDRLIVDDDTVTIIDYKTNRIVPDAAEQAPSAYVAQLALYRALMQKIYPQKIVNAGLLWAQSPSLMMIPDALLNAAFDNIAKA